MFTAIMTYFTGSLEELRHVRWPTQRQAVRLSVIVIIFIVVMGVAFGLVDAAIGQVIRMVIRT